MEKGWLKQRISKMFRSSSLRSCSCRVNIRNVTDAVQEPVFVSRRHDDDRSLSLPPLSHQQYGKSTPAALPPRRLSLDCGGGCRPSAATAATTPTGGKNKVRRVSEIGAFYEATAGDGDDGQKCPPVSPVSPSYYRFSQMREELEREEKRMVMNNSIRKKKKKLLSNSYGFTSSPSAAESDDDDDEDDVFFTSEEDGGASKQKEETETVLFSCKSLSSKSSEFYYQCHSHLHNSRQKKKKKKQQPTRDEQGRSRCYDLNDGFRSLVSISTSSSSSAAGVISMDREKVAVEEGFVQVVKQSRDPYEDFRSSMVEMIVEKAIFAGEDLEQLLHCYLSLNSPHHHRVILQVFSEIFEAFFGN